MASSLDLNQASIRWTWLITAVNHRRSLWLLKLSKRKTKEVVTQLTSLAAILRQSLKTRASRTRQHLDSTHTWVKRSLMTITSIQRMMTKRSSPSLTHLSSKTSNPHRNVHLLLITLSIPLWSQVKRGRMVDRCFSTKSNNLSLSELSWIKWASLILRNRRNRYPSLSLDQNLKNLSLQIKMTPQSIAVTSLKIVHPQLETTVGGTVMIRNKQFSALNWKNRHKRLHGTSALNLSQRK